jgi:hypothetical protein
MKKLIPFIMPNNGKPVALCNRCFCMMCFVACPDNNTDDAENCVVIERRNHGGDDFISTPIGDKPPVFCDKCDKLLNEYCLN